MDPAVLFVCEHGSAESVVAAAHFNRLAEAKPADHMEQWEVPPVSTDYEDARNAMLANIERLFRGLQAR